MEIEGIVLNSNDNGLVWDINKFFYVLLWCSVLGWKFERRGLIVWCVGYGFLNNIFVFC